MRVAAISRAATPRNGAETPKFPPLENISRPTLTTQEAAHYLNLQPQTLRSWACFETYPIGLRPVRIRKRLGWPTAQIRRVLGVTE